MMNNTWKDFGLAIREIKHDDMILDNIFTANQELIF